ncbi:hypothetical protein BC833DRAFT_564046 [Globomyces pollinis-pini]|nr:hypothetical protein BC833DRAFT_564046 [Globomyces pollinis-pini]
MSKPNADRSTLASAKTSKSLKMPDATVKVYNAEIPRKPPIPKQQSIKKSADVQRVRDDQTETAMHSASSRYNPPLNRRPISGRPLLIRQENTVRVQAQEILNQPPPDTKPESDLSKRVRVVPKEETPKPPKVFDSDKPTKPKSNRPSTALRPSSVMLKDTKPELKIEESKDHHPQPTPIQDRPSSAKKDDKDVKTAMTFWNTEQNTDLKSVSKLAEPDANNQQQSRLEVKRPTSATRQSVTTVIAAPTDNHNHDHYEEIRSLKNRISILEDTNNKLLKEKDRLIRDLDNHIKANVGERTGIDALKIQFTEQHAQNASLITHFRSLKTQIYELETIIEHLMLSASPDAVAAAKAALKQDHRS